MTIVLFACIVFVAFLAEAVVGFGSTVLTVTLGANLYSLGVLLPAFVPVNLALSAYLVARHHRNIDRAVLLGRVLPLVGLGLPAGLALSALEGESILQVVFGLLVITLASLELWRLRHPRLATTDARPLAPLVGATMLITGGVVHGIYGSGGPLIVYYAGRSLHDKGRFRATLSALWLVLNSVLVGTYTYRGQLTEETLGLSAALVPALLLGAAVGERVHGRVPERPFRLSVFVLLFFAGAVLATRALLRTFGG